MQPKQIGLIFGVVIMPITFLGCVYYPWAALTHIRWLQIGVLINPIVYITEGLRAALTPTIGHMPDATILAMLLFFFVLLTAPRTPRLLQPRPQLAESAHAVPRKCEQNVVISTGAKRSGETPVFRPRCDSRTMLDDSTYRPIFAAKSLAIKSPWNRPFSIKISFVRSPATTTPAR